MSALALIQAVSSFASTESFADSSTQLCSTISRTRLLYSRRSRSYSCDASAFAGDAGLGSLSKDWMEVRIADMSYIGLH